MSRARFGSFELDLKTGELRAVSSAKGECPVLLREQPFQVLRMLIERAGELVTREEIKRRLWPNDTVVDFDNSINVSIRILRQAVGDTASTPRYIETLARRGYRLIVPVESDVAVAVAADIPTRVAVQSPATEISRPNFPTEKALPKAPNHWLRATVVASVILMAVIYLSWRHFRAITPPRSPKVRLAVLPFKNLTGDPNQEYLADGLTEEMISQLGRLDPEQLGVIARTSVMGFKLKDVPLDQIGRDLSVQYVLENSIRANGNHLRLTAQLIQVKDQTHLWSQDYDYTLNDVLVVQDDVAKAVAREIQLRLTSKQKAVPTPFHSVNPEALDAYLQGDYFIQRNDDMAAKYFERATQLDPTYSRAWVGLSKARFRQADRGLIQEKEGYQLAREATARALALDPNSAEAHAQMGEMMQVVDFDWVGGDAFIQRALALEPGNPSILLDAAYSAARLGRFDEGLRLIRRSVELDPLDARIRVTLGQLEYWTGALNAAVVDLKRGLELNPQAPGHIFLAEIYVIQGRSQDALGEIEQERPGVFRAQHYAILYHALGREKESDAALQELTAKYHTIAAFQIAQVYAFRKQLDEAFEWLDRAYAQRDGGLQETKVNPLLKSLYNDPRYAAFLKKIHLPT